jgi:hypothetical protein
MKTTRVLIANSLTLWALKCLLQNFIAHSQKLLVCISLNTLPCSNKIYLKSNLESNVQNYVCVCVCMYVYIYIYIYIYIHIYTYIYTLLVLLVAYRWFNFELIFNPSHPESNYKQNMVQHLKTPYF